MTARAQQARQRKWLVIGGVALAVVIAGVVAVTTVTSTAPDVVDVTVTGDSVPVLAGNAPVGQDIGFGWDAPAVEGTDWNGNPVIIDPGDGRAKMIVFLAHWCPHCQAEVPVVQAWLNETGGNPDVDFYGIATSNDRTRPNWPPGEWLEREGWTPPTLMDENGKAARAYGMAGTPFWAVVNAEGKVVYRIAGGIGIEGLISLQHLSTQTMEELEAFISSQTRS